VTGQPLYQVQLSSGELVWFAKEPDETPATVRRKQIAWRDAHEVTLREDAAGAAEAARQELEAAGHDLEGFDATFWVPLAPQGKGVKGTGRWELAVWVLFRRGDGEPASAVCPDSVELTQGESDAHWMRELWLAGDARDIAEAPSYVKSLQNPED